MMPLSEIFFLGIVLYLLYRFVFNFFLPIFRTTRQVRQQFRNMQENNRQGAEGPFQRSYTQPGEPQPKRPEPTASNNTMGEYIDFEEIK
jgi:Domain of unknown function (DUF4834)